MNLQQDLSTLPINTICRTCLTTSKSVKQIFEVEKEEAIKFVTILKECTSIHISADDNLPKGLCQTCIDHVFNYYEFKRQCLLSEKKLINAFQLKTEDDVGHLPVNNINEERCDVKDENDGNNSDYMLYDDDYCYLNIVEVKSDTQLDEGTEDDKDTNLVTEPHIKDEKPVKKEFQCDTCGKQFRNIGILRSHKLTHGYRCHVCDSSFGNYKEYKEHIKDHKTIKCRECGKEFKKKYSLKLHEKVHTGERPHLCTFCGKAFALQTNLTTHLRIHNGIRPYSCQFCAKKFAQWSSWKSHLITHNRQRIHDCPVCGKSFYRKGTLRAHMVIHSDLRKYDCTLCSKSFKTSSELKRHLNIHTGEKMFPCKYCGKSFNRQSTLTVHVRIHTDERPHVCEICNRGFIQRHVLIQHMKTHRDVVKNE